MASQHPLLRARRRATALVALVAVAVTVLAATVVTAPNVAGAASKNALTIVASEYTYKLHGSPDPGWVTIHFVNKGVESHMMALTALKPGTTTADLKDAVSAEDDSKFNAIVDTSVGEDGQISGLPTLIGPKQRTTASVQLPAGHYGMLCFIPAPDGMPHAMHGMIKTFDIKGPKSAAKPPSTQATVDLTDTAIDFPLENPGRHLSLKITNRGSAPHSFALVKVNDGSTLDDVKSYFDAFFSGQPTEGEPPGEIVGGVDTIAPGGTAYLEQTLTRGHYGYVSTQGDDPSSDDYSKGLKGEFDVN